MSRILSQEELDSLLAEDVHPGAGGVRSAASVYDFRRPDRISSDQMRGLERMFETFCREFAAWLSSYLRTPVEMVLKSVSQLGYGEFCLSLAEPTCLLVFALPPLEGACVMEVGLPIVYAAIDRLLGGPGESLEEPRELTVLERALMERPLEQALSYLASSVSLHHKVTAQLQGLETNPHFVQVISPDTMCVVAAMEVTMPGGVGLLSIAIPYDTFEPVLSRFRVIHGASHKGEEENAAKVAALLNEVETELSVWLGEGQITVGELLSLRPGDCIRLEASPGCPAQLCVNGVPTLACKPGVSGKYFAAKVIGLLERGTNDG